MIKNANAPSNLSKEVHILSIICPLCLLIRCPNTSVSEVEEKMLPCSSNFCFRIFALTKFPLWHILIDPCIVLNTNGWTLAIPPPPAVEYLTCPIAELPCNSFNLSWLNTSVTSPSPLWKIILPLFSQQIPAASWPLCCKLCNP